MFEKDKLLFAFLLGTKLAMDAAALQPAELRFLLTGGVAMGELPIANPSPDWITDKMWGEMYRAGELEGGALEGLCEHVAGMTWVEGEVHFHHPSCRSTPVQYKQFPL